MTVTQIAAIVIFVATYVLIASERVPRVAAALGGAGLMLVCGFIDGPTVYHSEEAGIDGNVIFLLLGMMALSEREAIAKPRLLVQSLGALVLAGSADRCAAAG